MTLGGSDSLAELDAAGYLRFRNVPMITIAKMTTATMPSPIAVAEPPGSSPAANDGG
jgi:hypothetical protein